MSPVLLKVSAALATLAKALMPRKVSQGFVTGRIIGGNCTSNDTCCPGYICTGSNVSEDNPGTCLKNKGFLLFGMYFSLKHLVGIAFVMVATWFLRCGHIRE